jgi:hypothetical protein
LQRTPFLILACPVIHSAPAQLSLSPLDHFQHVLSSKRIQLSFRTSPPPSRFYSPDFVLLPTSSVSSSSTALPVSSASASSQATSAPSHKQKTATIAGGVVGGVILVVVLSAAGLFLRKRRASSQRDAVNQGWTITQSEFVPMTAPATNIPESSFGKSIAFSSYPSFSHCFTVQI